MSSLELRNGVYRVVFRYGGIKYARSLKTNSLTTAQAAVARLDDTLRRVRLGQLVVPENADPTTFLVSEGRLERQAPPPKLLLNVGQLFDRYVETFSSGALEATTEHCIRIHASHFKRVLGERFALGLVDLAALQRYVDCRAKAKGLRGKNLSPVTIKKELATLSSVWNWALDHHMVSKPLPKKGLRFPKAIDKPPFQTVVEVERKIKSGGLSHEEIEDLWDAVFLSVSEIDDVLEHVRIARRHDFLYPMFVFAAHTGARRSEMRRSYKDDFDFASKRVFLRERKRLRGRHTLRSVPMSPLLHEVMAAWFAEHPGGRETFRLGPEVLKSRKDRSDSMPLTDDEVGHHFQQVLLNSRWERLRGWHVFRHSFCSNCAAQGVDPRMINEWVGHQTEEMVRRYRHLFPNNEHQAISLVFGSECSTQT